MMPRLSLAGLLLVFALVGSSRAADKDDFVPLFNGKDLTGWVPVNVAPGTFFVKDNQIITTGKPTGFMRTEKQYENFIAEFEWMHVPPKPTDVGNSGFFVWADPLPAVGSPFTRGIEVQVLVNLEYKNKEGAITATSHGDIFSIWGAKCVPDRPHPNKSERCLPSENRAKGANEWNHYKVTAKDGVIKLEVNGKEVSGVSESRPRKGYLALESEGSECRFRNLKIKELPSSNPKPEEVAEVAKDFKNLFFGDLTGWKTDDEAKKHWKPADSKLVYDGLGKALTTEKDFGDAEFIVDFKFPAKKDKDEKTKPFEVVIREAKESSVKLLLTPDGPIVASATVPTGSTTDKLETPGVFKPAGGWNRLQATIKDKILQATVNGKPIATLQCGNIDRTGTFSLQSTGEMEFTNIFVRELK